MPFCFYPRLEQSCPNVSHCPHLGGAAIGTVVHLANETQESREYLHRTIDAERQTISQLLEENERLQKELDQVKRELKLERQNKFATNEQKGMTSGTLHLRIVANVGAERWSLEHLRSDAIGTGGARRCSDDRRDRLWREAAENWGLVAVRCCRLSG